MRDRLIRCLGHLEFLEEYYSKEESRENKIIQIVTKDALSHLQEMVESEVSKQLAKMRNAVGPEANPIPAMPLFSCSPQQFISIQLSPRMTQITHGRTPQARKSPPLGRPPPRR